MTDIIKETISDSIELVIEGLPQSLVTPAVQVQAVISLIKYGIPIGSTFTEGPIGGVNKASLRIGSQTYQLRYSLISLRAITALEIYSQAIDWIEYKKANGTADRVLADDTLTYLREDLAKRMRKWLGTEENIIQYKEKNTGAVFLSHSESDKHVAEKIISEMKKRSINISLEQNSIQPGDSLIDLIKPALSASDYIVVLFSRESVKSSWVQQELVSTLLPTLSDRDITLLPVIIEDCVVPPAFIAYHLIDLRPDFENGLDMLIRVIANMPYLNFERLSPLDFESLIKELLSKIGFIQIQAAGNTNVEKDPFAEYRALDSSGNEIKETYIVEVKLYRYSRADL